MCKTKSAPLAVIVLLLIIFVDSFSYFLIIPVLLKLVAQQQGALLSAHTSLLLRNILYGVTIAISPLAYFFTAPLMGYYSDSLGRKKILAFCLLLAGMGFLFSLAGIHWHSLAIIMLGRLVGGIGSASQPIAWAALSDNSVAQKSLPLNLGFAAVMMTIAMIVGPSAGVWLSNPHLFHLFNDETPFLVSTLLVGINLLLLSRGLPQALPVAIVARRSPGVLIKDSMQHLVQALTDQRVRGLLLLMLVYEFAWSLYFQVIPLYFTRTWHYTPQQCTNFINWSGIWMLAGLLFIYPYFIRKFSVQQIVRVGLLIFMLTLLAAAMAPLPWGHWLAVMLMSIVVGMIYPSLLAWLCQRVQVGEQGWVMGAAGSMLALSWLSSGMGMGELLDVWLSLPLWIAAVAALIAMVISNR